MRARLTQPSSHRSAHLVRRAPQSLWMSKHEKCSCEKPLLQERSEQKGSSESWCGRCKLPLGLRTTVLRSAFT